jgi:hypothetical protein
MRLRFRMLLVTAAALFAGIVLKVWLISRDEASPDISDLPEIRPVIPDSENAFLGLLAVAQTVAERERTDAIFAAALNNPATARNRTPEEIAHVRTVTGDLVAPWREAVSRPRSVAPAFRDPNNPPYSFGDIRKLGRLASLWCAHERDNPAPETVNQFTESLRCTRHLTESYDSLVVYITGITATHYVLNELADFVDATPPKPDLARKLISALETSRLAPEPLAALLHNEAHFAVRGLRDDEVKTYIEGMVAAGIARPPPGAAFFRKPNQSARWWVEEVRSGLAQLDVLPVSALVVPNPNRGPATTLFGLPHPDNAFGRHYAAQRFFDFSGLLRLRPLTNARLFALQAFIALRAEQAARGGELPATLDELAPAYFPRVPTDAADGAPIRYSRERAIVWSVGATNHEPSDEPAPLPAIEYRLVVPVAAY